jgi:hypothetical protein
MGLMFSSYTFFSAVWALAVAMTIKTASAAKSLFFIIVVFLMPKIGKKTDYSPTFSLILQWQKQFYHDMPLHAAEVKGA